jgi:hypothetical protein
VRSAIRFLHAKGEGPAEILKQIVALCGLHLFLHLKKRFAGKVFDDDDEVQEEVMTLFKGQAAEFYDSGMQKLVPRLNKCLNNAGDYVEK